ncbi:peptidoglycan recognition family protein [Chlorogloeopsis sp. ULAP01]|uniref:N-acetylmuramoyl-L-alanine amidase n=1 Tax=Chlorogloeopsis sp. ULAP01 TaxID=3056483 RepID=UPI0025AB3E2F|nr:peptidoglycan recognition family protein [Chlorogloeopsis sp. ULAP01]MDM9381082.1 peptidoglycan recognition family protein [Chlorogloeopsis sp. ULAP01]
MSFSIWIKRLLLISLMLITTVIILISGRVQLQSNKQIASDLSSESAAWSPSHLPQQTAQQKEKLQSFSKSSVKTTPSPKPKAQLESTNNQQSKLKNLPQYSFQITQAFKEYRPRYEIALAHPNNYGERHSTDINGISVNNQAIIVLHETGGSASSAINTFQVPHEDDDRQVSYHTLVKLDGTVVYIVSPEKRAFGAANSVFDGPNGSETVQTNSNLPPSVNNFAYHVSLETPPEGHNEQPTHVGYTDAQYYSLAWLIAQSSVPDERITTHKAVDRSGQKNDPRSFDFNKFFSLLHSFRQPIS